MSDPETTIQEEPEELEAPAEPEAPAELDFEARMRALDDAERAIDMAYSTGRAERSAITELAQRDAALAVELAGNAIEADELADDARRMTIITERSGDREKIKLARAKEREARKQAKAEHRAATKAAKQAYDAIKFSDPTKMGFMRFVQVSFALHIFSVVVFLLLTSRDSMSYNVSSLSDWVMVVLEGIAFWMFINRYKIARPFVMGMAGIGLAVTAVMDMMAGKFSILGLIFNGFWYVFLLLYFGFSKRVRTTLVNDLSKHTGVYDQDDTEIKRSGWPFYRNLIMYFIVFSIMGHWMEMAMCQLIIAGLVEGEYDPTNTMLWRDWLYPFPMEGAAVVIIALALYPLLMNLKKRFKNPVIPYVVSFLANALTCSLIEFSMGLIVNADLQLWDYTNNFGNIMGQVCLQNTIAFGIAASVIAWFVYPMLERWIARQPSDVMNIVFVGILVFGLIVWSLYLITPPDELDVSAPKTEEELAQEERDAIETELLLTDTMADSLYEQVQGSEYLSAEEQQELLEHLAEVNQELESAGEVLGVDVGELAA